MSFIQLGNTVAHVSEGGPARRIMVGGVTHYFEMHRMLGVLACDKTGGGIEGTKVFWKAVTKWAQQGERMHGRLAIYDQH